MQLIKYQNYKKKNLPWVGSKEGIHCFTAAVKLPWRFPPAPPPKRPLKQVTSVCNWLPATSRQSPSAGGAGVMLIMGMDLTGASCVQLACPNTIIYKLLQLGHHLPQGWSVLCCSYSRYQTSDRQSISLYIAFSASAPLYWWALSFVHFTICQPQWWSIIKTLKKIIIIKTEAVTLLMQYRILLKKNKKNHV